MDDEFNLEKIDQEIRINELEAQVDELASGNAHHYVAPDCPPGLQEEFLQRIIDYETAPLTCDYLQLEEAGFVFVDPDSLSDDEVSAKLWELIRALAKMRVFITCTDHLSDRGLYEHLVRESLLETHPDLPGNEYSACHLDLLSRGSEEDTQLYLKYFADEEWRRDWMESFPDYDMPPHEDPPYDRDRLLPEVTYGPAKGYPAIDANSDEGETFDDKMPF